MLTRRGKTDGSIITGVISAVVSAPCLLVAATVNSSTMTVVFFAPFMFFASFAYGAAAAALQTIAPNQMRA